MRKKSLALWKMHFNRAEQLLLERKTRGLESHALKALKLAEEDNCLEYIARSVSLLATFYIAWRRPEAEKSIRRSVQLAEEAFGPDSEHLASELQGLASFLESKGNLAEARAARERALKVAERSPNKEAIIEHLDVVIQYFISRGLFEQAQLHFLRVMQIRQQLYGDDHPEMVCQLPVYIEILRGLGEHEEAEAIRESLGPEGKTIEQLHNLLSGRAATFSEVGAIIPTAPMAFDRFH